MTSGFRVVCSDGVSRHGELFATRRDALTWQTWRHVCHLGHTVRREATWPVESFRLRPHSSVGTGVVPFSPSTPEGEPPAPVPAPIEVAR